MSHQAPSGLTRAFDPRAARNWITGIVAEPEVGTIYTGKVASIVDFGAFVTFMPGKDGLVHVSEIKNERVENVRDVLAEGQEVKVKLLEVDPRGKVRLSMRLVDQETSAALEDTRPPREPREPSTFKAYMRLRLRSAQPNIRSLVR